MPIDKSWIDWGTRCSRPYFAKIDEFLDFAYVDKDHSTSIYCPCRRCENRYFFNRAVVREHLRDKGFWTKYKVWTKHGEKREYVHEPADEPEDNSGVDGYMDVDMVRLVEAAMGTANLGAYDDDNEAGLDGGNPNAGPNESTKQLFKLMEGANKPLYPGSRKHTALSCIVRLLDAKVEHSWTDTSFKELLQILEECLPEGANLPKSYYEAQKLTDDLGFNYYTVDACPNSCMLFRKTHADLDACLICKASRWKDTVGEASDEAGLEGGERKAAKKARYFPLKPRLQRLFMSCNTAELMR